MSENKLLYMIHKPPLTGHRVGEAFDALLTAAVFDQELAVLFRGDGVWCLMEKGGSAESSPDEVSTRLKSLPDYGVEAIYACKASLEERGLRLEDLSLPTTPLDFAEQQALLAAQTTVLTD